MGVNDLISLQATSPDYPAAQWPRSLLHQIQAIVPAAFEPADFSRRVMGALAYQGNLMGIACQPHHGDEPLLASLLRYEMRLSAHCADSLIAFLPAGEMFADRLAALLVECAQEFPELSATPTLRSNPLTYIQWKMARMPARHLVAPCFHRSVRAKLAQIGKSASAEDVPALLSKFISYPLLIATNIPALDIRPHWSDYRAGEFERLVSNTIARLALERNLSRATLVTMQRDWEAGFGSSGLSRPYEVRGPLSFSPAARQRAERFLASAPGEPEDIPPDDSVRRAFLDKCERDESSHDADTAPPQAARKRATPTMNRHYRLGIAAVRNNPSPAMPNALPMVTAALIRLKQIQDMRLRRDSNTCVARAIVDLLWHTGHDAAWIASLQVSHADTIPESVATPTYMPHLNCIVFAPQVHVGWPEELSAQTRDVRSEAGLIWQMHDMIYEPVSSTHEIFIPRPLADELALVLSIRPAGWDRDNHLFLWQTGRDAQPVTPDRIDSILEDLARFIQQYMPRHSRLSLRHWRNTFEAWYTSAGLCPEHRFLISDRARGVYELSYWYQTTALATLHQRFCAAYTAVEQEIRAEAESLAAATGLSPDDPIAPQFTSADELERRLHSCTARVGSWRCARIDSVRRTIAVLADTSGMPELWDRGLLPSQAQHNALTRLLVALLLLFLGLRPFEIARIKVRHVDLALRLLTVDAKPHCERPAVRRLPLAGILVRLIERLLATARDVSPYLLFLYSPNGAIKPVDAKGIENILAEAGKRAGLARAPEAYAWRHLFCRTLMELDVPFHVRRYCMGHEAEGIETFNAYSDHSLDQLEAEYQRVAEAIIKTYGLQRLLGKGVSDGRDSTVPAQAAAGSDEPGR